MESSPNPTPDIPLGITFRKEPETPSEDKEEEDHPDMMLAEALCMLQESEWEGKRVKFDMLVDALSRPYPDSWVAGQVMEHPYFTEDEQDLLKEKLLTFLLDL